MNPSPSITPHIPIPQALVIALQQAKHIVVFTGAGVSAESGIATFRDALTGLWERFSAQDLATPEAFHKDEALVWGWYEWRRMQVLRSQPNPAHFAIAALAQLVPKLTVITQNVDDLHERAGSTGSVCALHLHGSLHNPRCAACGQAHILPPGIPEEPDGGRRLRPPRCLHCGGSVRPGVVWFGEELPVKELSLAFAAASECDVLFAIGTSGLVQPAAGIPLLAKRAGAKVIQVNPTGTQLDEDCTWSLRGAAGEVLPGLLHAAFSVADAAKP